MITAKIRRMSRRRQKIAIARRMQRRLDSDVASGLLVSAKVVRVSVGNVVTPHIDVELVPLAPVHRIEINAEICERL